MNKLKLRNSFNLSSLQKHVLPAKAGIQRLGKMPGWVKFIGNQNAEEKGGLGLYLLRDKAVAIWTTVGAEASILHQLCVTPSEDDPVMLPLRAARAILRQNVAFDEVFIAVGCGSYTQYSLHSEFEDPHQIESTIKYDAEEAATTDAVNLAVAFEITGLLQPGSQVTAYTADRQLLTDILLDVQEGGLDPTLMEPDVVCLARALEQTSRLSQRTGSLFVALSGSNCYMLRPNPGYAPIVRAFLVEPGKDMTSVLIREVLLAMAAGNRQTPLESIVLIGDPAGIDKALLKQRTGLEVLVETPEKTLSQTLTADGSMTPAELLMAYGAAMAGRTRGSKVDFRRDFMPYQGKRKVMLGSLRLTSIALTVLLVAIAGFFQLKTLHMKSYTNELTDKTLSQYKAAMYGKLPPPGAKPSTKLKSTYAQVKEAQAGGAGIGDSKSVPAKLTFFLEAVNSCPKHVDVNIQQITITDRSMKIKGDTNSRSGTNALFDAIKKHPHITLASQRIGSSANRDTFEITIEPKQEARK